MNTYNEKLQQTAINTLAALSAQQSQLASAQTAAQYSLYYAQGAEITARDKLTATNKTVAFCQSVNDQSLINDNQADNLFATVTTANTCVSAGNTNMATAASNVQIASNAIAMLASDIGAALNIATASLFNTDSYKKILDANNFVNDVANDSKNVSMLAMDASGKTSEIISKALLAQATTVNMKIDNLLAATQTELNKFADLSIAENKEVGKTTKAEQLAEGVASDADREAVAIGYAYKNANAQLNFGLNITVNSATQISVSFSALPSPLPTFLAQPASGIAIPGANPNYYLTVVAADKMAIFSTDQAEQLFASWIPGVTTQFYPLTPDPEGSPVMLVNDAFNNPIRAGNSYVAYLYIALSMEYKRFIGNFMDMLSAPCQAFIPATTLPLAKKCTDKLSADALAELDACAKGSLCFAAESMVSAAAGKAVGAAIDLIKSIGQAAGVDTLNAYNGAVGTSTDQADADTTITDEAVLTKAQAALLAVAPSTAPWYPDACEVVIDTLSAAYYATVADAQGTTEADAQKAAGQSGASAAAADSAVGRVVAAIFATGSGVDPKSGLGIAAAVRAASKMATVAADTAVLVINKSIEFRCILVESGNKPDLNLMFSPENNNLPIYFNLNVAQQISPANYVVAAEYSSKPLPVGPDQSEKRYRVIFEPTTTDNFGNMIWSDDDFSNMIRSDKTYLPYILTTVNGDMGSQYVNVLSSALDALKVIDEDEKVNK